MTQRLTGTGLWSAGLRYGGAEAAAAAAAELDGLGYSALWIPDVGGDVFAAVRNLLAATSEVTTTRATTPSARPIAAGASQRLIR